VNVALLALLAALAALTVWGAISPRGQWRVLAAWTRREPYASEPGPVSVGIHRGVAIVASVALVMVAICLSPSVSSGKPPQEQPQPLSSLWGSPEPVVVNRVYAPSTEPPIGLMAQPVLRYQAVNGFLRDPSYLFALESLRPVSKRGYIGVDPRPGLSAMDSAYLVVQVRADPACIPRDVVVQEDGTRVAVGVYYGRPDKKGGGSNPSVADCEPGLDDAHSVSTLIPIALDGELKDRKVTGLDGTEIPRADSR